jgi:hypothetical protein
MTEKRNDWGMPEEDRSAIMLGMVMIGMSAGFVFFLIWEIVKRWR